MSKSPIAALAGPSDVDVMWRAILFADLVGYSTRMGRDELGTLEFMVGCSQLIKETAKFFGGDVAQTTGDGYLMLFEDPKASVDFGVELHRLVAKRQSGVPDPAQFRVGIHFGRVHRVNDTIHGHAVNIAARLEAEASPGSCIVSQAVRDAVGASSEYSFEAAGSPPLKNIAERIALYRVPSSGSAEHDSLETPATIQVIGELTLRSNETEIRFRPDRKASALLGYLALTPGMRERGDKAAKLLSPDVPMGSARRAFHSCRRHLTRALGDSFERFLTFKDGSIGLNELQFDTDLDVTLRDLRRGRVPAFLIEEPDWPERVLEGFGSISPVFSAWRRVICTNWRNRVLGGLADLLHRNADGSETVRDAALAIRAIETGNEEASVALIRYHGKHGNRVSAIDEFTRLRAYLNTAYGLEPSKTVLDALGEVTEETRRTKAKHPAKPKPVRTPSRLLRIAVNQFADPDDTDSHLASGFRSELVANLARFREWSVVESNGLSGGSPLSLNAPGRSVCDYFIDGVFDGAEGAIVRLQLCNSDSKRAIWSATVPLDPTAWSESQREVVGRIAAHLETYISADRLAQMISQSARDPSSYDTWLQAEKLLDRWSPEAADEAEALLESTIKRDAAFARAYSSLASFLNVRHVIRPGLPRDAESERTADELAQRAIELDPLDARNQLAVAWTAALTGAFDRAGIHLDLAASLNPNCPATLISCAMGHAFNGQADRGETLIAHALRISPMLSDYQWCYIASVRFLAGRYQEALDAAQLSGDRIIDNQGWTTAALVRLGRMDEARSSLDRLIDTVRPIWAGAEKPTAEAVFNWFVGAYPLREAADRELLAASLETAMRGQ